MVVSFAISFGVMRLYSTDPTVAAQPMSLEAQAQVTPPPLPRRTPRQRADAPVSGAEPAYARGGTGEAGADEAAAEPRVDPGAEMPVVFSVVKTTAYTRGDEDASYRMTPTNEAVVLNSSDKPLSLTLIELHLPTMESTRFEFLLPAGSQRHVGPEQGMKFTSGDQLTLRSPSFRDILQQIP